MPDTVNPNETPLLWIGPLPPRLRMDSCPRDTLIATVRVSALFPEAENGLSEVRESHGTVYLAFLASTHFAIHVYTMLLPVLLLPLQDEQNSL